MQISEHKELGPNTIARRPSDFLTGVPIKKRRFPFIRHPSPPPQISSTEQDQQLASPSLTPASPNVSESKEQEQQLTSNPLSLNVSQPIDHSSFNPDPSSLNPASPNVSQQKVQHSTFNPESSSFTVTSPLFTDQSTLKTQSSSLTANTPAGVGASAGKSNILSSPQEDDQESVVTADHKLINSNCVLKKQTFHENGSQGCSKITLEKIEGSSTPPNKEFVNKGNESNSLMNIQPRISEILVKEEVNLALDSPSLPDVAVQGTEGVCEEEKLDPCSWNLALTEGSTKCNMNVVRKINCALPHPQDNRNNWDLNTMMDTWEGSGNHSAMAHGVCLGAKRDIGNGIYSQKYTLDKSKQSLVAFVKNSFVCSEDMSKLATLSAPDPQIKNDVLLHLSLSTSSCSQSSPSIETSCISAPKLDSRNDPSDGLKVSKNMALIGNIGLAASRIVKPEPSDEINKQDFQGGSFNSGKSRIVKSEPCVGYLQEHSKASFSRGMQLIAHGPVKPEPVCGFGEETLQLSEKRLRNSELKICNGVLSLSSRGLPVPDIRACIPPPITSQPVTCTTLGLPNSGNTSKRTELLANIAIVPSTVDFAQKTTQMGGTDSASDLVNTDVDKSVVANNVFGISRVESGSVHPESPRVKAMDKMQSDSHRHNDAAESDEEKINLFDDMQDDCSSDTDEELVAGRGNCDVVLTENQDRVDDDDDYEDGELREPLLHITSEVGEGPDKDMAGSYREKLDTREVSISGCSADGYSAHVEGRDMRLQDRSVIRSSYISEDALHHNKNTTDHTCLQVLSSVEEPSTVTGKMEPTGELPNRSGKEALIKVCEDGFSDATVTTSQGTSFGGEQGSIINQQDNANGMKPEETKFSVWSKAESVVVRAEATKDVNSKGNSSRIINLARAFSGPSPGRIRSFPGRFLPSRIERERYNDGLRNGDKLHPRGSRDDDGRYKFERQRNQDYPLRSTTSEFMHGRGRPEKRFDSPHAAVMGSRDGTVVGSGRKPLRDEVPSFRNITSRRRSPGGRGRPVSHAAQVVRRSRDVSPGRCIGRGDPNLIGLRPEKKYMRRLPDDMINTVFSRSQPQCQQVDDHFVSRDRSYSPVHRKGSLHSSRLRSNSPSRTRSPGPWSSPRRRSPDAFVRPELIHRRSPPFYRMKRMRSPPQRPVFSEDVDGRRHGSPPYISRISNELRDMSASREPDHQRSFIQNRSPSGRVLARGARRVDMMDPRDGIDNDEYFAGTMHSDRFHEIGPDGSADGRRICADRRRSFRPTYDADVVEKFHFQVEGGSRSYRFSPEADAEFQEGGNMRDRDFDRRVKNRSGNTPRSTRSGEEHDENYRHGEQGWDSTGFEDVSPAKRRRF